MKSPLKCLVSVVPAVVLFAVNLCSPLSVKAAVPCDNNTVSTYTNGSLESCILSGNVELQETGRQINVFYPCKQGYFIFFNRDGNLRSCVLSTKTTFPSGKFCNPEFMVYVSRFSDGSQFVSCHYLNP